MTVFVHILTIFVMSNMTVSVPQTDHFCAAS